MCSSIAASSTSSAVTPDAVQAGTWRAPTLPSAHPNRLQLRKAARRPAQPTRSGGRGRFPHAAGSLLPGRLFVAQPLARGLALMRTEPPLRTFLRTFVSTNGRRRPSYAPFFYFGVLFIAREGKCGAKRREKFDCWACQHQFLVNNNHSKARCTQELLLLRLKSLLLLCVLAGWFLQERKEREANEQQQREAPRKIPRCVSCVTSISGYSTTSTAQTSIWTS